MGACRGRGHSGSSLNYNEIECAFCAERGNFKQVSHYEKKKPNFQKKLNFDTLECNVSCGYVMVLWSNNEFDNMHEYRVLPAPLKLSKYPKHWPEKLGRYWIQANQNLQMENWESAAMAPRSALQFALRHKDAVGGNLKGEIDNLAEKGILPPIMKEWSNHVRLLGNNSAHPEVEQEFTNASDVRAVVYFLDFLLTYLYNLPYQIEQYTNKK